ncbi:hypothetical protein SAMN06295912_10564 [Sphingomonas laterariae]|uniref:Uncharacterized protein n=1 Tax=Edaphosphingomonas laterariae TaxID=861865 RepID=A0A239DVB5_9SPHN|nr:hypothetical protein [Sphingomonas laterariae]SNS36426.1 hypothetical protein SAMN06295912_10564 [Sphingomonas laterariae]
MKLTRNKLILAALLGGAALGPALWPAMGQEAPESLLPPGFGDAPPAAPAPQPAQPAQPGRPAPAVPVPAPGGPVDLLPAPPVEAAGEPVEEEKSAAELAADAKEAAELELPTASRRPIEVVGVLDTHWGMAPDAFGNMSGVTLNGLLQRTSAPMPSRWASMLVRRALLSRVQAPRGVAPQDWVAERAWMLLRMGEADGARMLVQAVDVDRFTPRLLSIAAQTALATADPAGLCPLTALAGNSQEPIWPMATAICTSMAGDAAISGALIDRTRDRGLARGIDTLLAEKVIGAGSNGRRAITIEWTGVSKLTSWRFGLASATNVPIPDELFATVGPQARAWQARAPLLAPASRIGPARTAAALGVFSSAALVDLYGAVAELTDEADIADSDAGRLRTAFVGEDAAARMTAIRALWTGAQPGRDRYAALILTARAAARVQPGRDQASEAGKLIASMLSAGLDYQAARWAPVINALDDDDADDAWALLAVGVPRPGVDIGAGRVEDYVGRKGEDGAQRARLLVAALAGLGRLNAADAQRLGEQAGVNLAHQDAWTRAIDAAARRGEAGTVALLVATGMQTRDWQGVPAQYFSHMLSALRAVGLEGDARMIAAEAMTRA